MRSMTPSQKMSDQQIGKIEEILRASLRKHQDQFGTEEAQRIIRRGGELQRAQIEKMRELARKFPCLTRRIGEEPIILPASDGKRTFAGERSTFPNFLDPNFTQWGLDVPCDPSPEMEVVVHEQVETGTFEAVYSGFNASLDHLCLPQDKAIEFFENESMKYLRPDGWAWFRFLLKINGSFFVAHALRFADGNRRAYVGPLSDGRVWSVGHRYRFVVPQL